MRLGPAPTRVLLALIAENEDGHPTMRSVAQRAGITIAPCYTHLCRLRDLGLVEWEDGTHGTLRPAVQVVARL